MTKKSAAQPTSSVELENPSHGGSYLRKEDGSLELIEGPAVADTPPAPAAGDVHSTDQSEG